MAETRVIRAKESIPSGVAEGELVYGDFVHRYIACAADLLRQPGCRRGFLGGSLGFGRHFVDAEAA